jgi:RecB family exonuclease
LEKSGGEVLDGVEPAPTKRIALSPSQLATFQDCKRKWAFDKLDGLKRPESASANAGTAIHKEVEEWVNGLVEEPKSAPAKALVQALKDRGIVPGKSAAFSEVPFNFVWPNTEPPIWIRGIIDLLDLSDPTRPQVIDFKTVSSKQGFKRADDVKAGPQGVVYPLGASLVAQDHGLPPTTETDLTWIYAVREEPTHRPAASHTAPWSVPAGAVEVGLAQLDPLVREMAALTVKKAKALEVLANPEACFKYGPCPYREHCPDAPKKKTKESPPVSLDALAALASLPAMTFEPAALPPEAAPAAPQPLHTPPTMPLLEALKPDTTIAVQVVPPDARPNVSANDPPPPPAVETKRGRGRPKGSKNAPKVDAPVEVPSQPPTDNACLEPVVEPLPVAFTVTTPPPPPPPTDDNEAIRALGMRILVRTLSGITVDTPIDEVATALNRAWAIVAGVRTFSDTGVE